MTTKTLLDEYAGAYRAVDNCSDSIGGVEDCHICKEDRERMQEIIQELEASIRKEVINGIINCGVSSDCIYYNEIEEYALSKGIDIK